MSGGVAWRDVTGRQTRRGSIATALLRRRDFPALNISDSYSLNQTRNQPAFLALRIEPQHGQVQGVSGSKCAPGKPSCMS